VLATPEATDHQNIRQFMLNGWDGIQFESEALAAK
ncbi:MAG: HopJ type III effector protein, partial [Acinetobacter sp.]